VSQVVPTVTFTGLAGTAALRYLVLIAAVSFPAVASDSPRPVVSLTGDTLRPVPLSTAVLEERHTELSGAQAVFDADPDDPDAIIWLGRRNAYLGRYHEAVDIFTRGIALHPDDARMFRHRGHRFITVRKFDDAIADLTWAAELTADREDTIEPDGLPNALNIPTSTLQTNIWYHLGLARYLKGDFAGAAAAYAECVKRSKNNDMLVATLYWYYLSLRRLGHDDEATILLDPVHEEMKIIENDSYFTLLLFFKEILREVELTTAATDGLRNATVQYGMASWLCFSGDKDRCDELMADIVQTPEWAAFGYIAAEADLCRSR